LIFSQDDPKMQEKYLKRDKKNGSIGIQHDPTGQGGKRE